MAPKGETRDAHEAIIEKDETEKVDLKPGGLTYLQVRLIHDELTGGPKVHHNIQI
jgi:hypothetical protein